MGTNIGQTSFKDIQPFLGNNGMVSGSMDKDTEYDGGKIIPAGTALTITGGKYTVWTATHALKGFLYKTVKMTNDVDAPISIVFSGDIDPDRIINWNASFLTEAIWANFHNVKLAK